MARNGDIVQKGVGNYVDVYVRDESTYAVETGVAAASISFAYCYGNGPTQTYTTIGAPASWMEKGIGHYQAYFPAASWGNLGHYYYTVTGTGFAPWQDYVKVGYANDYEALAKEILDSDHSEAFSLPWCLKTIMSAVRVGNFAEVNRETDANGLGTVEFKSYDFTGTQNAQDADDTNLLGTHSLKITYDGGTRSKFTSHIAYPDYTAG